jgi:hypothetical protein
VVQATQPVSPAGPVTAAGTEPPIVNPVETSLERHPDIRNMLRERVRQQPQWGPRDIKRLLTVWQFYVRVLDKSSDLPNEVMISRARNLVVLAEIITRWPALQRRLQAPVDGGEDVRGLDRLAAAVPDDIAWARALRAVRLDGPADRFAVGRLRALLGRYDGVLVAELAREVW